MIQTLDLAVPKGAQVVQPILVTTSGAVSPLPSGTTAKMQIRSNPLSAIVLADLSVGNGMLTVDLTNALVTIKLSSTITAGFAFERAVYDLDLIYSNGEHDRIVEGKVFVLPNVTQ